MLMPKLSLYFRIHTTAGKIFGAAISRSRLPYDYCSLRSLSFHLSLVSPNPELCGLWKRATVAAYTAVAAATLLPIVCVVLPPPLPYTYIDTSPRLLWHQTSTSIVINIFAVFITITTIFIRRELLLRKIQITERWTCGGLGRRAFLGCWCAATNIISMLS